MRLTQISHKRAINNTSNVPNILVISFHAFRIQKLVVILVGVCFQNSTQTNDFYDAGYLHHLYQCLCHPSASVHSFLVQTPDQLLLQPDKGRGRIGQ